MSIDLQIRKFIEKKGYITIDELMRKALTSYSGSYYNHTTTLGQSGDFITSPEISQLFGEIIGLWCIDNWQKLGKPKQINLVELGPGRGLLMRDLLKVAKIVPEFYSAISIELVEINSNFIKSQHDNLKNFGGNIKWLGKVNDIANLPCLFIANEFFDALPIKQYIKIQDNWYESILIIDPNDNEIKFSKLVLSRQQSIQFLSYYQQARNGAIVEKSFDSSDTIASISKHIKQFGGAGLIIDYGYYINSLERTSYQYNSTLQAIKNHQYHPILGSLGDVDLSAHVDFYNLEEIAKFHNIKSTKIESQHEFLINQGILYRAEMLKKSLPFEESTIIDRQIQRIISKTQMGQLFKVLHLNL